MFIPPHFLSGPVVVINLVSLSKCHQIPDTNQHIVHMTTQVISTDNLSKAYGETRAVNGVSISVREGSLFGLLGPNGSGKTSMIRMLTGQIYPTGGSARVLGFDPAAEPVRVRELVGIIPEQESPPSFLTAGEYLHFVGSVRNLGNIEEKARWWLDFLEFSDKRDVLCKDLSRGTRQKLMFAQAFIHQPRLAIIDEPLINFDPLMQQKVKEYLVRYVKSGNTVFFSTHILEVAEEICSEIAILHQGNLLFMGPIDAVLEEDKHLYDFFISLVKGNRGA
jgi:ABC-2 type transport system ATP-binding protein